MEDESIKAIVEERQIVGGAREDEKRQWQWICENITKRREIRNGKRGKNMKSDKSLRDK